MQKIWEDNDLGKVVLRKSIRSKQYTIRLKRDKIMVSLPYYGSYKRAIQFVKNHKDNLLEKLNENRIQRKTISLEEVALLQKKALEILPLRIEMLASKYGLDYTRVRITRSKSRWGSCSSKKSINLSLYLIILPDHLIDYVLLHELCHTRHMNHGPEFWLLMEQVCSGQAKKLQKELRQFQIP